MDNRALLLAVASCFALTGCPDKPEPPKAAVAPVAAAPKPPEAPAAPPASSGPDAKATTQVAQGAAPAKASGKKKKPCKKGGCDVTVSVSGGCTITLDTDDLEVEQKNNDDEIRWGLLTKDYKFSDQGITFKDASATGPKGQFYNNKNKGTVYVWWDRNTDNKTYKYSVEVLKPDGKPCPRYDPSVVNGVPPSSNP